MLFSTLASFALIHGALAGQMSKKPFHQHFKMMQKRDCGNNCDRAMQASGNSVVASSFCSTFLVETVVVTPSVTVSGTATISPTRAPIIGSGPQVTPAKLAAACTSNNGNNAGFRLSSACSCLSVKGKTTATKYGPAVTITQSASNSVSASPSSVSKSESKDKSSATKEPGQNTTPPLTVSPFLTPPATSSPQTISTPAAVQSGMVTNCNKFYLAKSGDDCDKIGASQGITRDQLVAWNRAIGSQCGNIWANYYVCVGTGESSADAASTSPTVSQSQEKKTTAAANVVDPPGPTQTAWGQCGGTGYTGITQCGTGHLCIGSGYWYSCQPFSDGAPTSAASSTSTTTLTSASTDSIVLAAPWEKCGGIGWTGPTLCSKNYKCVAASEWYSQCVE